MNAAQSIPEIEDVVPELEFEPATDYLGVPLTLTAVEWRTGQFGEYAVAHVATEAGETAALSCGSESVMRQLRLVEAQGAYPVRATLVKEVNPRTGRQFMRFCSPSKVGALSPDGVRVGQ